jgi:hypothetical protein
MRLTNFRRILHETPPEVKTKVKRMMSNQSKLHGMRRRLLHSKYKPDLPKAKNKEQGRLIYLMERKLSPNVLMITGK